MPQNPYAIPVEELESRVRVPVSEQVEALPEPQLGVPGRPVPIYPFDGGGADLDAD